MQVFFIISGIAYERRELFSTVSTGFHGENLWIPLFHSGENLETFCAVHELTKQTDPCYNNDSFGKAARTVFIYLYISKALLLR